MVGMQMIREIESSNPDSERSAFSLSRGRERGDLQGEFKINAAFPKSRKAPFGAQTQQSCGLRRAPCFT